jgi:hypothetical protein
VEFAGDELFDDPQVVWFNYSLETASNFTSVGESLPENNSVSAEPQRSRAVNSSNPGAAVVTGALAITIDRPQCPSSRAIFCAWIDRVRRRGTAPADKRWPPIRMSNSLRWAMLSWTV